MKKILFLIPCAIFLISCGNGDAKIREANLMNQINKLTAENIYLKGQLEEQSKEKIVEQSEDEKNIQKIGRWRDVRAGANQTLILNKNLKLDKYYLICCFDDGSSLKDEVRVTKEKGLMRFQIIHTDHVEWYIVEKNGDLSMWSQNGKFATALCY